MHPIQYLFLEDFSYVLEIDRHFICAPMLTKFYSCKKWVLHLVTVMVMLILLVWRIGFGMTGMEFVGVMPTVQGFVRCNAGSLWIVIIPKSKDRFMERPPMKKVQP
jgi:hypothetical protein